MNALGTALFGLVIAMFVVSISECCDTDNRGREDHRCYRNHTCDDGLRCVPGRSDTEHDLCVKDGGRP